MPDDNGTMCKVPFPTRVWNALSEKVFALLKPTIEPSLRLLHQSIEKYDGIALVKRMRCQTDNIAQSQIQLLEMRRDNIKLSNLSEWQQVRGDIVKVLSDWNEKIRRGEVPSDEVLSERKQKDWIGEVCDDVLPGICEWIENVDNVRETVQRVLVQCDTICITAMKRLERKRNRNSETQVTLLNTDEVGETSLYGGWDGNAWSGKGKGEPPVKRHKGASKGKGKGDNWNNWSNDWSWWNNDYSTPYNHSYQSYNKPHHYHSYYNNTETTQEPKSGNEPKPTPTKEEKTDACASTTACASTCPTTTEQEQEQTSTWDSHFAEEEWQEMEWMQGPDNEYGYDY
jgi:hypothetical protein